MPSEPWLIFILVFGNLPHEETLQSGLTCLLGLCSHFEQKRGFFMQGCLQLAFAPAPILHWSAKATKAKLPSWVGQGRHLTPYLGSNSIQELNYRKGWKLDACRGIIFILLWSSSPSKPLSKTAEQLWINHYLVKKEVMKKWHLSGCALSLSVSWVFLFSKAPMHLIGKGQKMGEEESIKECWYIGNLLAFWTIT